MLQKTTGACADLSVCVHNAAGLLHVQQLCLAGGIAEIGFCKLLESCPR